MSLNRITSQSRLNNNTSNPTLENSSVTVGEVNEIIDVVNEIIDGTQTITEVVVSNGTAAAPSMTFTSDQDTGIYLIGANNVGVSANGAKVLDIATTGLGITGIATVSSATDSTSKDTGSIITEGGVGVEKAIFAGTTINAGTALTVGTDQSFAKEVNHVLSVSDSTTSNTTGGRFTIKSGAGNGTGAGGNISTTAGAGGDTGNGGVNSIGSGAGGATSGDGGALNITTGGASGTANTGGDIVMDPGACGATATVSAKTIITDGLVRKPLSGSVGSGGTITGKQLVDGLITATGATGNWQLPTAAQITTAIGATPAGTNFEFVFNASGMTATNIATLVVGSNMSVQSSPPITGGGTLTISQSTQVVGRFWVCFDTATTCKIVRLA